MNAAAVVGMLQSNQIALFIIMVLEMTGYMFPPPIILRPDDIFDFILIGGGTSGAVIATRLAQQEFNVLVIEAGADAPYETTLPRLVPYLKNSHVDYNYTSAPDGYTYQCQVGQKLDLGVGKMLGGSSELNYMYYSRGTRRSFDQWHHKAKDDSWTWEKVLPYFKRSENVSVNAIRNSELKDQYGTKGYIGVTRDESPNTDDILEGFHQAGHDIIDDIDGHRVGYSKALLTIKDGFRQGAGSSYMKYISESRYIATAKNTLATRIMFDDDKNAVGVEVITDKGETIVVKARKEIIISAGVFKSPQLLILSGIGPKKLLDKFNITSVSNLPVGKYLKNQDAVPLPFKINKRIVKKEKDPGKFPVGAFVGYASLKENENHKNHPDYSVAGLVFDDLRFMLQFFAYVYKYSYGMSNKLYDEIQNHQVVVNLLTNLYPRSRGQVSIQSTDPKDPPKVVMGSFSNDRDIDDLVEYIMHFMKVNDTNAFRKLEARFIDLTKPRCDIFETDSKEYWRCYILCMMVSLRSYTGTCSMGSVVDSRMLVKGVQRLRIADACIIPVHVSAYIYNTVVMIGEKAADLIMEDAGVEYMNSRHEPISIDQIKNMPD
ncbi:ecdysone oxidase-like [Anticarsia gemmatalis]|uniref:ecdysone oxidase-like n=1 Tax=Anticarsia gemmatalis TaxID=129554 RepID=UPI003F76F3F3